MIVDTIFILYFTSIDEEKEKKGKKRFGEKSIHTTTPVWLWNEITRLSFEANGVFNERGKRKEVANGYIYIFSEAKRGGASSDRTKDAE